MWNWCGQKVNNMSEIGQVHVQTKRETKSTVRVAPMFCLNILISSVLVPNPPAFCSIFAHTFFQFQQILVLPPVAAPKFRNQACLALPCPTAPRLDLKRKRARAQGWRQKEVLPLWCPSAGSPPCSGRMPRPGQLLNQGSDNERTNEDTERAICPARNVQTKTERSWRRRRGELATATWSLHKS